MQFLSFSSYAHRVVHKNERSVTPRGDELTVVSPTKLTTRDGSRAIAKFYQDQSLDVVPEASTAIFGDTRIPFQHNVR